MIMNMTSLYIYIYIKIRLFLAKECANSSISLSLHVSLSCRWQKLACQPNMSVSLPALEFLKFLCPDNGGGVGENNMKKNIKDKVLSWYTSLCSIVLTNWHKVPQDLGVSLSSCQGEFDLQYLNMKNWAHIMPVFLHEDLYLVVHSLRLNTPWWSLPLSIDKIFLFSPWLKKK